MSLLITGCSDNRTVNSSNSNKAQINLVDGVYSAYYNDYNDLSLNLTDNLTEINENLKRSEEETSAAPLFVLQFGQLYAIIFVHTSQTSFVGRLFSNFTLSFYKKVVLISERAKIRP